MISKVNVSIKNNTFWVQIYFQEIKHFNKLSTKTLELKIIS